MQREPDLTLYQMKLQSNLTYLATMADISMTKPEDVSKNMHILFNMFI
jgi:hypothetical protein